ncbi:hypothetical protein BJ170DRAFT_684514 [Xylariales sp. AK1849]|nr:hypothetical protein BJ170DRAFT_684514 [Xylariales sp. AK1849]
MLALKTLVLMGLVALGGALPAGQSDIKSVTKTLVTTSETISQALENDIILTSLLAQRTPEPKNTWAPIHITNDLPNITLTIDLPTGTPPPEFFPGPPSLTPSPISAQTFPPPGATSSCTLEWGKVCPMFTVQPRMEGIDCPSGSVCAQGAVQTETTSSTSTTCSTGFVCEQGAVIPPKTNSPITSMATTLATIYTPTPDALGDRIVTIPVCDKVRPCATRPSSSKTISDPVATLPHCRPGIPERRCK